MGQKIQELQLEVEMTKQNRTEHKKYEQKHDVDRKNVCVRLFVRFI